MKRNRCAAIIISIAVATSVMFPASASAQQAKSYSPTESQHQTEPDKPEECTSENSGVNFLEGLQPMIQWNYT